MNMIQFMELLEERRREAYKSPEGGTPTIGVGHKITAREEETGLIYINRAPVEWRNGLTEEQVDSLCMQDLSWATRAVEKYVDVALSPNQRRALISFVFNIGEVAFRGSTLLSRLNHGDYAAVPGQMRIWNKMTVDGKKVGPPEFMGLANRREIEVREWLNDSRISQPV